MRMTPHQHDSDFRHAALFYFGEDGYVNGLVPFIQEGVEAEEPVLVMVPGRKTGLLREALGQDGADVHFTDMADVGANPARIIPAWHDFVSERSSQGRRVRGIGEPIWADRTPEELVECQHHEALLNFAFDGVAPMDLVCPYDSQTLGCDIVKEAMRSHPIVLDKGNFRQCAGYAGSKAAAAPFDRPLSLAPADAPELAFDVLTLDAARRFVAMCASEAGLSRARRDDVVIAVNELADNSVMHGGGGGLLRAWIDDQSFVAEVRDQGLIDRPLAGREAREEDQVGGQGLWLVNQLCDLMQIRTFPTGTVVRVYMRLNG